MAETRPRSQSEKGARPIPPVVVQKPIPHTPVRVSPTTSPTFPMHTKQERERRASWAPAPQNVIPAQPPLVSPVPQQSSPERWKMPQASKTNQPRIQMRPSTSVSSTQRPSTSSNPISIPKKHSSIVASQPSTSYGRDVDMTSWDVLFSADSNSSSFVRFFLGVA